MPTPPDDSISAACRTVLATIPGLSGLAQAWSEVDNAIAQDRINGLVAALRRLVWRHEERLGEIERSIPDQIRTLTEMVVRKVIAQPEPERRNALARGLAGAIQEGDSTTLDAKISALEALDTLSPDDVGFLATIVQNGRMQVAGLLMPAFQVGQLDDENSRLANEIDRVAQHCLKLEGRGLIAEAGENHFIASQAGNSDSWMNRWRRKTFAATPSGRRLIQLLNSVSG